jgi:hypothetical protein
VIVVFYSMSIFHSVAVARTVCYLQSSMRLRMSRTLLPFLHRMLFLRKGTAFYFYISTLHTVTEYAFVCMFTCIN